MHVTCGSMNISSIPRFPWKIFSFAIVADTEPSRSNWLEIISPPCIQQRKDCNVRNNLCLRNFNFSPKEKFICRVCGRMLSTKGNLEVHEGTHIAVDSSDYIKCTVCSKAFKSRRFMVEHRKLVHDKSKVVACPNCSHVSTCKGSHNIHFKSVHLVREQISII